MPLPESSSRLPCGNISSEESYYIRITALESGYWTQKPEVEVARTGRNGWTKTGRMPANH